jgi:ribulose-phosphate 3-epimerase
MLASAPILHLGVKTDPIECRYSWDWLFSILQEEDVKYVQLGSFFEMYQLPDRFFLDLRSQAEHRGIRIASVFTAHRELGGFLRADEAWERVARASYRRAIEVGSLVGASSVGSNPGAVMRDQMSRKEKGLRCYLENMKRLMHYARECGVPTLAIEPMSCLAEPPSLPSEITEVARELSTYHSEHADDTSPVGYCFDVSHGYVDSARRLRHTNEELLQAALPYVTEMHLKNTDAWLESTFGFGEGERSKGIIDIPAIRECLIRNGDRLPVKELIGYLEIGGPKVGRDYSDCQLESMLRDSLHYLKATFPNPPVVEPCREADVPGGNVASVAAASPVKISASMMCADMGRLEEEIEEMDRLGVAMLHWDLMDGHFVPNMPCGLAVLEQLRGRTRLPFDVHLMVEDNDFFIHKLAPIGVDMISIHYESGTHCHRSLSLIRESGAKAGLALNPSTPVQVLEYVSDLLDFVLLMTVNPGFAGQALVGSAMRKIADCRTWLDRRGLEIPIEVDGNVSFENIPGMVAAGADILVAGTSSLFHKDASRPANCARAREAIAVGLNMRAGTRPVAAKGNV